MITHMKEHRIRCVLLISILLSIGVELALLPTTVEAALNLGPILYMSGTNPPPTLMPVDQGKIIDATSTQAIAPIATDAPSIQIENPVATAAPEYTDQQKQLIELIKELTALLAQLIALRAQK